jgi:hypothetical protein
MEGLMEVQRNRLSARGSYECYTRLCKIHGERFATT